ncbi:MAG: hypothetical protein Q7S47_01645 [bacterium]|nr:hypothetical protein [bacterium]
MEVDFARQVEAVQEVQEFLNIGAAVILLNKEKVILLGENLESKDLCGEVQLRTTMGGLVVVARANLRDDNGPLERMGNEMELQRARDRVVHMICFTLCTGHHIDLAGMLITMGNSLKVGIVDEIGNVSWPERLTIDVLAFVSQLTHAKWNRPLGLK